MPNKIIELAKKLKTLADRGVDGEKENAITMLQNLMVKHGLSMADIEGEKRTWRRFKVLAAQDRFFLQVVANVLGDGYKQKIKSTGQKIYLSVEVTAAEYVELAAKYEFYWNHYQKELEVFYLAFIQKNHLYKKETDEARKARYEKEDQKELTAEEKAMLLRMAQMMAGMEAGQFHKQLSSPK